MIFPIASLSPAGRIALCTLSLLAGTGFFAAGASAASLDDAAERYRPLMISEIGQALAGAQDLQKRVAARDLEGAQKAWITSRVGWERAEVFTSGFVSELDEAIDAWPNAQTGFHAIEAQLFGAKSTDLGDETGNLVLNLSDLDIKIRHMPLNAQGLMDGMARLAYEVGESKADGGESRFSGTSLDDMRNNVTGIAIAYKTIFCDALKAADPALDGALQKTLSEMTALVDVDRLETLDTDMLRQKSEELIIALQTAAPKIGLTAPSLEVITQ